MSERGEGSDISRANIQAVMQSPHLMQAYRNLAIREWAAGNLDVSHDYYTKCVSLLSPNFVVEKRESCSFKEYCLSRDLPYAVVHASTKGMNVNPYMYGLESRSLEYEVDLPEIYLAEVRDAEVLTTLDAVLSPDGAVICDMFRHPQRSRYLFTSDLMPEVGEHYSLTIKPTHDPVVIPEGIQLFGTFSDNYSHWIMEFLPRLKLINHDEALSDVPLLVDTATARDHHFIELLKACCPRERPLVFLEPGNLYRVERLHVPSRFTSIANNIKPGEPLLSIDCVEVPEAIHWLRENLYLKSTGRPDKLIYIPRRTAKMRRLVNEDEVDVVMEEYGFIYVEPETMNLAEKQALFSQTDVLVNLGGSGSMNIIFAPPGATFIGSCTIEWQNVSFTSTMCHYSEQPFYALCGEKQGCISMHAYHADYRVDIDTLRGCLDEVLSKSKRQV